MPSGPHKGEPLLEIVGAARQDSGSLEAFASLARSFGFSGGLMASEVEVPKNLMDAKATALKVNLKTVFLILSFFIRRPWATPPLAPAASSGTPRRLGAAMAPTLAPLRGDRTRINWTSIDLHRIALSLL